MFKLNCFIPYINIEAIFVMFIPEGMANGKYGTFRENAVGTRAPRKYRETVYKIGFCIVIRANYCLYF